MTSLGLCRMARLEAVAALRLVSFNQALFFWRSRSTDVVGRTGIPYSKTQMRILNEGIEVSILRVLCLVIGVYTLPKPNSAQSAMDLLVLTVLERRGPLHGYGIATEIERLSAEALRVEEGSLYPALHRMESLGWIAAEWRTSDTNRRARFYGITATGRKKVSAESERWKAFSAGVARVLKHA